MLSACLWGVFSANKWCRGKKVIDGRSLFSHMWDMSISKKNTGHTWSISTHNERHDLTETYCYFGVSVQVIRANIFLFQERLVDYLILCFCSDSLALNDPPTDGPDTWSGRDKGIYTCILAKGACVWQNFLQMLSPSSKNGVLNMMSWNITMLVEQKTCTAFTNKMTFFGGDWSWGRLGKRLNLKLYLKKNIYIYICSFVVWCIYICYNICYIYTCYIYI